MLELNHMTPPRILMVGTEATVATDLQNRLGLLGCQVAGVAATGEAALALAKTQRPDLVLMDLRLPGAPEGLAAAGLIRQRCHLPVVFVTADVENPTLREAQRAEPFGYIHWPFQNQELQTVLAVALCQHRRQEELRRLNQLHAVLSHVQQTIVRGCCREVLFAAACRVAVEEGGFKLAWMGWLDAATRALCPLAQWSDESGHLHRAPSETGDQPEGYSFAATAVREGETCVCNDLGSHDPMVPGREAAASLGLRAVAAVPIRFQGKVCGAFAVLAAEPDYFQEQAIRLLEELGRDISFALDRLEAETQRGQAQEEALRRSEAKYRELVEHANSIILRMTPEGRITFFNEFAEVFFGYTEEEILGRNVVGTIVPNTESSGRDLAQMIRDIAIHPEQYVSNENENMRRNGERVWTAWTNKPVRDASGAVTEILCIGNDVTGRKRAQEALHRSERNYREIFDASNDAIFIHDPNTGAILDVNDTMLRMYGFSREEALRLTPNESSLGSSPYSATEARSWMTKAVAEGPQMFEWQARKKSGELFWVEVALKVAEISGQRSVLALVRDISKRKQTEAVLDEAQSLLRAAVEQSPAGIVIADAPEVTIRLVNSAALEMRGATLEPLAAIPMRLHARHWSLFHPDGRPFRADDLPLSRAVLHGETTRNLEVIIRRETGEDRWTLANAAPVRNSQGEIVAGVAIFADITERKRATEALRESEERYRRLVELSPDPIYVQCGGRVVFINTAGLKLFGAAQPEQILGKPMLDLIHPNWRDVVKERMRRLREGHCTVPTIVEQYLRLDGSAVDVEVAATRFAFNGKPAVLVIARDITERKEAEAALEAAHQRLQDTIESLPDATFILDQDRRVIAWNRACEQLTGVPKQAVLGQGDGAYAVPFYGERRTMLIDLLDFPSAEMEATYKYVKRVENRLYAETFVPRLNLGQGGHCWSVVTPLFDRGGKRFGAIEVIRDITERQRLEEQLRQTQKIEAVGQLAGGVAHDFNNILTAILINLTLLHDDPHSTPEIRAGLKELEAEANRAASLTRQLLLFSRREQVDAKPLDLKEIINGLAKMLRRLIGEDIELVFPGQSGSFWIKADAGMMEQVVMNLCVNARDAMPKGGKLTLGLRRVEFDAISLPAPPEATPGWFICLSVTDTGRGMKEATLKRIFEPFFTTKEPGKGTGLGLATVHGIVKQHQGWIEVESTVGAGSAFRVYLPAWTEPPRVALESATAERVRGGTETILLVEDELSVRRVAALCLRKLGYAVVEAANAAEALQRWEEHPLPIDLLLTDMIMPGGVTGLDLAAQLRERKASLRIILSSGYTQQGTTPGLLTEQGLAFLAKPYENNLLARTVRDCLDQTSAPL